MRRWATVTAGVVLLVLVALLLDSPPVERATAASTEVTRFAVTVTDTSRRTRCPALGIDRARELYVQVSHPTAGAGHPVVVFAHGMRGDPDIMHDEIEAWAARGYVVVVPRFPLARRWATDSREGWECGWADITNHPADISFVLDGLAARTGGFARVPAGVADTATVGVTGISSGGITAFLFYNACCRDPRVRAIATQLAAPMLVEGGWQWGATPVPLLMVNERDDPWIAYAGARAGFSAVTGPRFLFTLPGGPHHSSVLPRADTPPEVWQVREHLFRWVLQGDDAARARLVHAFDRVDPARGTWELDVPLRGGLPVTRLAGDDRVATAIRASREAFPAGARSGAVLARADDFPDALAGVPLAGAAGGPLLLTARDQLDPRVGSELQRVLRAGATVHLLGGSAALGDGVARAVAAAGFRVERHAGADRFATAVRVAGRLGDPDRVLLATGRTFPDALSAGAAAAATGAAVLLTDGDRLPPATSAYLAAHPSTRWAIGGPSARALPSATPVVGPDRYTTAVAAARTFFERPARVGLATGERFPDALGAGAHLAAIGAPLLLSPRVGLPPEVAAYAADHAGHLQGSVLYGGQLVLSEGVRIALNEAVPA